MSDYKVTDSELTGIANAIRTKGGTSSPLVFPDGFTSAIGAIPTGGGGVVEPLSVTQNGTYIPPSGVDGYAPVSVNVSSGGSVLGSKTIVANGLYNAYTDELNGYSSVYVQVPQTPNSQGVLVGADDPTSALGANGDYYYKRKRISASDGTWLINDSFTENSYPKIIGVEFVPTSSMLVSAFRAKTKSNRTGSIRYGTLNGIIATYPNITFDANEWAYVYLDTPVQLTGGVHYIVQVETSANQSDVALAGYTQGAVKEDIAEYVTGRYGGYPGSTQSVLPAVDFIYDMQEHYKVEHEYYKDNGAWTQII